MSIRLLPLLALLLAHPARGSSDWRARVSLEAGADGNPERIYDAAPDMADGLLSALIALQGWTGFEGVTLSGAYDLGARAFLQTHSQHTLIQAARVEAELVLAEPLTLEARGRAKDRRGARREYTDLSAALALTWLPDARLSLELSANVERFLYRELPDSGFVAGSGAVLLRYLFDRRHSLLFTGEVGERRHQGHARTRELPEGWSDGRRRFDGLLGAGVSYGFRGTWAFSVGYGYLALHSNSFGETVLRHRATATVGLPLPWKLTLLGQLGLQLASFPDGVYLSPELFLVEDDENQNALSLKLVRPLSDALELELRYALYQNRLAANRLDYLRQVAGIGLSWRLR